MKVLCFGTFDILHPGHVFFLREAKKYGELSVVVALDETVMKVKGKAPRFSQEQRKANLEKLGIAGKVVLGNPGDKLKVVEDIRPDIICLGYDQQAFTKNLQAELLKRNIHCRIIRLPAFEPHKYKSSLLQ